MGTGTSIRRNTNDDNTEKPQRQRRTGESGYLAASHVTLIGDEFLMTWGYHGGHASGKVAEYFIIGDSPARSAHHAL